MVLALNMLTTEIQKSLQPANKLVNDSNFKSPLVEGILFQGIFATQLLQSAAQQEAEIQTTEMPLEDLVSALKALINDFPRQEIGDQLSQADQENLQQLLDGLTKVLSLLEADEPEMIVQGLEQLQLIQQQVQQKFGQLSQPIPKNPIVLLPTNLHLSKPITSSVKATIRTDLETSGQQDLGQAEKLPVVKSLQVEKGLPVEKGLQEKTDKWIGAVQKLLNQALTSESFLIQEQKRTNRIQEVQQSTQQGIKQTILDTTIFSPVTPASADATTMVPVKNTITPSINIPLPMVRLDQLAQDLPGIFRSQFIAANQQGMSQIRVTLFPENLGHLDIRITSEDGKMIAQLITNNAIAKETLEFNVNQLKTALQQQGISLDKIEISQQQSTTSSLFGQNDERSNQQFFNQRDHFQRQKQNRYFVEEEEQSKMPFDGEQATSINYVI